MALESLKDFLLHRRSDAGPKSETLGAPRPLSKSGRSSGLLAKGVDTSWKNSVTSIVCLHGDRAGGLACSCQHDCLSSEISPSGHSFRQNFLRGCQQVVALLRRTQAHKQRVILCRRGCAHHCRHCDLPCHRCEDTNGICWTWHESQGALCMSGWWQLTVHFLQERQMLRLWLHTECASVHGQAAPSSSSRGCQQ